MPSTPVSSPKRHPPATFVQAGIAASPAYYEVAEILNERLWPLAKVIDEQNNERQSLNARKNKGTITPEESRNLREIEAQLPDRQIEFLRGKVTLEDKIIVLSNEDKSIVAENWGAKLRQCRVLVPGFNLVIDEPARRLQIFSVEFMGLLDFLDRRFPPLNFNLRAVENELEHLPVERRTRSRRDHLETQVTEFRLQRAYLREEGTRRLRELGTIERQVLWATRGDDLSRNGILLRPSGPS
ncbi:hypothetical protein N7456_000994 [Penicillium angulare]|uniref:Uncharacterized protein n=1 Tax=Penicillium angulare TaxID=116970 RepID=A0A9W9GDK1_9EURO|nr:hypothetical protein N7456_000994 [Penicillium angulare]